MEPRTTLRIARPTDALAQVTRQYMDGLGLIQLGEFRDHDGFDGVMLGFPQERWHLEFTTHHGSTAGRAPTQEHLLVFYIQDADEWQAQCDQMLAAGFTLVPSFNPYWDRTGRTFEDVDGYRVVLQHGRWPR